MKHCEPVWTDETLRELAVHGTEPFPFTCYHSQLGCGPCASVPWHWHREVELVLARHSVSHCMLGGERIALQPGEAVFIHSGVLHSFEAPAQADIISILFMPEFVAPEGSAVYTHCVAPFTASGRSHAVLRPGTPWQAEVIASIGALSAFMVAGEPTAALDIHTEVCRMWGVLLRHLADIAPLAHGGQAGLMQARLRRMIGYIEANYAAKISLADIAADASISKSEALRCFRCGVQTTPIEYLNRQRLRFARMRLLATAAPVTEVAAEAGFASTAYFDRVFRRCFGLSPAQYRRAQASLSSAAARAL